MRDKDFGRFTGPGHQPLMAMVEITNRCNMQCPICFTNARKDAVDPGMDEIKKRLHNLLETAGPIPVQISGGEPCLHPDLPEIITYTKSLGFKNIELVTNGIVISQDPDYLNRLVESGLTAVYLQFDGLQTETYMKIRGRDMTRVRTASVDVIRKAGICCTLAVAVTRHVNDHELGDIVRFGVDNIDTVRAINFQSASRFNGRFDIEDPGDGFALPELTHLIEQQAGIKPGGFRTDLLSHPHCNAMSLVYAVDDRLEPLFTYISEQSIEKFLGPDKRQTILDLFLGREKFYRKYLFHPKTWKVLLQASAIFGRTPNFQSLKKARHILLFAKSFMEKSSQDTDRLHHCCYGIAGTDGVYSFCAYNNFHRFQQKRNKE